LLRYPLSPATTLREIRANDAQAARKMKWIVSDSEEVLPSMTIVTVVYAVQKSNGLRLLLGKSHYSAFEV
jgi:hypothetical protein